MAATGIVFPHQLYENSILLSTCKTIYLVEEWLYFKQYNFHKQKLAFHRASMKFYEEVLKGRNIEVIYIDSGNDLSDIQMLIPYLKSKGMGAFHYIDTTDYWLEQRIKKGGRTNALEAVRHPTPMFLNSSEEVAEYFSTRSRMFQTDFYKHQRLARKVLLEDGRRPLGGKWTFDEENRKKFPKGKMPPPVSFPKKNKFYSEAITYTQNLFPGNYGDLNLEFIFPTTYAESKAWLKEFFSSRLAEFGVYEDALVSGENILNHGVLTPMLNSGLLTPDFIIDEALLYASNHEIPLNSLEGFIRQIMGWREFMRAVYELKGREERTKNYWGFKRKIPESFWEGRTGIEPVDLTIRKVLNTGYCHHIERLMVLGNFLLLCEFDPDEVYRWFMELFIDAYDWVMVPNVYGMSQFADGGLMSTKPYISGSNYLIKMGDYKKGSWQKVWDGLFWRFMDVHRGFFLQNPRLGMLVSSFDKMDEKRKREHLENAEQFLSLLDT